MWLAKPDAKPIVKSSSTWTLGIISLVAVISNFIGNPENKEKITLCAKSFNQEILVTNVLGVISIVGILVKLGLGEVFTPRGVFGPNDYYCDKNSKGPS